MYTTFFFFLVSSYKSLPLFPFLVYSPGVFALYAPAVSAAGVMVVPVGVKAPWARQIRPGAGGVRAFVTFNPNADKFKSRGGRPTSTPYRGLYALAFLDFRSSDLDVWRDSPSAEALPALCTPLSTLSYLTMPLHPPPRPTRPQPSPQAPARKWPPSST